MKSKKAKEELSPDNIYPHGLSPEEEAAADKELVAYRMELWNNRSKQERLRDQLMQLKYQIKDVVEALEYQEEMHFGYFLSAYIRILEKKQKEFAAEISVDETRLSRIIHKKEFPNDELFIRLEIHSNNTIPAFNWFMLAEKGKGYNIRTNKELRKKEKKNVHKTIAQL
jgi:plasmid maintenance system antidote protein VapI